MARLPDPIIDKLLVEWPEESEYEIRRKDFFSILGESVRKVEFKKKREGDKDES